MLKQLTITNYALIAKTDIDLNGGLTVITGETGAGKSIMLGALGLLLGQRADVQVLLDKEKKCVVEALFDVSEYDVQTLFKEEDVEYDQQTIIRREILPTGKSRAFVNDTPVNLTFLKQLSQILIDIHSQHQNLLLSDDRFHLNVIDAVAQISAEQAEYTISYKEYCSLLAEEEQMVAANEKMKQDYDYMLFQHKQLEEASLQDGEMAELERERDMLVHAEEIKTELSFVVAALGEDGSVVSTLSQIEQRLGKVANYLSADDDALARIESARIDMADLFKTLERQNESIEYDPERLQYVESRLDVIYSLLQKHHVQSEAELIVLQQSLAEKLNAICSFDEQIESLRKRIKVVQETLMQKAEILTDKRCAVFGMVTDYIEGLLKEMGMQNARFEVSHSIADTFTTSGVDNIRFLFAANKNGEPTDIAKVASGGEMSRVMLAIKWLLSKSKGLPTIIFDEIDTGVSGEVADKMGEIMREMSGNIQVVAITHLPQVAAKGDEQFKVYKQDDELRTISNIVRLTTEERVEEIAKMLSGATVTEAALLNAKILLKDR
jgi:DNA repair protein RecN (Recombination protein N)